MSIDSMIEATIGKEGGYSNHKDDTGGATMWGITEAVARRNGYKGDMRNLLRSTAVSIYRDTYAVRPGFAAVAEISPAVGEELFDTGVNMGPGVPAMFFQRALNALNRGGTDYPDVTLDGQIGPATLSAFKRYRDKRGSDADTVMLKALNALQGNRYIELAEKRGQNESFLYGWLRTRV